MLGISAVCSQVFVLRIETVSDDILHFSLHCLCGRIVQSSSKMFDVSAAIDNALSASFGEFSKLTDEKLDAFAESFSLLSGSRVKEAVRKATWTKETFVCKKKGNQQQLDHYLQVLEKLEKLKTRIERIAQKEGQRRNTRTGSVYEGRN